MNAVVCRGGTRVGLQPGHRPPADTVRTRLARVAAAGLSDALADIPERAELHLLARRGAALLARDLSRGGRLVARLCRGLDRALSAVAAIAALDLRAVGADLLVLSDSLAQAEDRVGRLEREVDTLRRNLAYERQQCDQLRALLAVARGRTPTPEEFEEPTKSRPLTREEKCVVDDPDAEAAP